MTSAHRRNVFFQVQKLVPLHGEKGRDLFKYTEVGRGKQTRDVLNFQREEFRRKAGAGGLKGEVRSHSLSSITPWRR